MPKSILAFGIKRVPVNIQYILRAQKVSHIMRLRSKYIPCSYMDPLGLNIKPNGIEISCKELSASMCKRQLGAWPACDLQRDVGHRKAFNI